MLWHHFDVRAFFLPMKKLTNTILVFLFTLVFAQAQVMDSPYFERDTVSTYTVGLNTRFLNFQSILQYQGSSSTNPSILYKSQVQSVGIRGRYKAITLVLGAGVKSFPTDDKKVGSSLNIVLRYYPKNFYLRIDASYIADQYSLGNYVTKFRDSYRNDLFVWNLDNYAMYTFSRDRINIRSFMGFLDKQLRTAGSFTANAYLKGSLVHANSAVVDSIFGSDELIPENLFFSRIGLGVGYLQTVKITEDLSFIGMASFASEFAYSRTFDEELDTTSEFDFITNLNPHAFSSLVYRRNGYYTGLQFEYFPALGASRIVNKYDFGFYSLRLSAGYHW